MTLLGEVVELCYGKALKAADRDGGGTPVVGSGGVCGSHSAGITDGPTIVVGRKGSIGSVIWIDGPAWPIDTAYFARPRNADTNLRWIFWMLKSLGLETMNKSAAVPGLNRDDAYRLTIDVPPVPEQRRIAAILDHADALRTKRRQVLAHLDSLRETVFQEMFGRSDFPLTRLDEFATVASGITKGRRTSAATTPAPYLAVSNVQAGYLNLDVVKSIDATSAEIERYALRDGDVVLTEGGDPDKLGRGTIWREQIPNCLHQNHIFRVRPDLQRALPDYLAACVAAPMAKSYFLRSAKQTTGIASINMMQLRATPIPIAPMTLQLQFLRRTELIASNLRTVQHAMTADDQLFASLQSRAFRGEL